MQPHRAISLWLRQSPQSNLVVVQLSGRTLDYVGHAVSQQGRTHADKHRMLDPIQSPKEYEQLKDQMSYAGGLRPRGKNEKHQEWIDTTKARLKEYRNRRLAAFARKVGFYAAIYAIALSFFWWYEI